MRKVKTLLTTLFVMLVSVFVSACTCTEAEIVQVLETGISIRCTTETINSSLNEESGDLTIMCHKGDEFTIEYTLTPANATTTRVDWEFTDNKGTLGASSFSYSKSTVESVTFTANNVGSTDIIFTTNATGKTATAKVTVYQESTKLPTLVAPEGLDYNPETATVTWKDVRMVTLNGGPAYRPNPNEDRVVGLIGYRVTYSEYKYDKNGDTYLDPETTTTKDVTTNELTGLEMGKTYSVKVSAIGNEYNVKSGAESEEFLFHQLAPSTDLKNNNGEVTLTTPQFAVKTVFTCTNIDTDNVHTESSFYHSGTPFSNMGNTTHKLSSLVNIFGEQENYTITARTFAKDSLPLRQDGTGGYAENNSIRYYCSPETPAIEVKRLAEPAISLENVYGETTISGVKFENVVTSSRLKMQGRDGEGINSNHQTRYQYFILARALTDGDMTYINNISIDTTGTYLINGKAVTINITRDSEADIVGDKENTVFVRMIGNTSNTICSAWQSFGFVKLGKVYNTDVDPETGANEDNINSKIDIANWSINNNVLEISSVGVGQTEYYFVNMDTPLASKVITVDTATVGGSYDISKANLAPGKYKIYTRLVGQFSDSARTLTGTISTNPLAYVTVLSTPTETSVSSEGIVKFKSVTNEGTPIENYTVMFTKGDTTTAVKLLEGAELNDGIVPLSAVDGSGFRTFSLYDVARIILSATGGSPSEIVDELLNAYMEPEGVFAYSIIANDNASGSNIISSPATRVVSTTRLPSISDIELAGSNSLVFTNIANNYVVVLQTDSGEVYSEKSSGSISGSDVILNLGSLRVRGSSDYILDLLTKEGSVTFRVYGVGVEGLADITGKLDSVSTTVTFNCSAVPTGIVLSEDGTLSWLSTTGRDGGEALESDPRYQIKFTIGGVTESITTEPSIGTFQSQSNKYLYSYSVKSILEKYEGETIAVEILEIVPSKFAGRASDSYYMKQLTTVSAGRGMNGSEPVIIWNTIADADGYILTCSAPIFGDETYFSIIMAGSEVSADRFEYSLPGDLALGEYNFTVVAYHANGEGSGTELNPYIINSGSTMVGTNNPTTSVLVLDGKLQATVNGTNILWSHIENATYEVSYRITGSADSTNVESQDILYKEDSNQKYFSASSLVAGEYNIQITPIVVFETSGVILRDLGAITVLTKLASVSIDDITTSQGLLQFTYTTDKEVVYELYTVNGDTVALIPTSSYSDTVVEGKHLIDLFGLVAGEVNIAIKVKSVGTIDSDLSEAKTVTKLAAVSDFIREGDYFTWTPIAGTTSGSVEYYATHYEILLDDNNKYTLKVTKDGSDYKTFVLVTQEGTVTGEDSEADTSIFDYVDGKLKFKPDAIVDAGQYTYKIKATITTLGFLNSKNSSTVVTKLHNTVDITVDSEGIINFGTYTSIANNEPTEVSIVITKVRTITEGEGYEPDPTVTPYSRVLGFAEYSAACTENGAYKIDIALLGHIGFEADGVYSVTVQFIGNGGSIITSEISAGATFDKLTTTSSISSNNGTITWTGVTGAEKYSLEILDENGLVVATLDYTALENTDISLPSTIINDENGVSNLSIVTTEEEGEEGDGSEGGEGDGTEGEGTEGAMSLTPATSFTYIADTKYSIRVMAKKNGSLSSKWSNTFSFKKLKAITNLSISRTDSIVREDGTIVYYGKPALYWTNTNSSQSDLQVHYIDKDGKDIEIGAFPSAEQQYFELDSNMAPGQYNIKMQALGNTSGVFGLLTSDMSEVTTESTVTYIANETTPTVENGKLTWKTVPEAFAYKITATNTSGTKYELYKTGTEVYFNDTALADKLGSGYWNIRVLGVTDPRLGIVSEQADAGHNDVISVYRPAQLIDYKVKNGMLAWKISLQEVTDYIEANPDFAEIETETNTLIGYIVEMATNGESQYADTYGSASLEHFYKVNLNINGIDTIDTPTEVNVINSAGETVADYANGEFIEFIYDVSITTDFNAESGEIESEVTNSAGITYQAGYYNIKVSPVGDSKNVLEGEETGVLSAYKLSTPKSWYDAVETLIPKLDEGGQPVLDGEGNPVYDKVYTQNDIAKGKALWELSVINSADGLTYHKDYTLRAVDSQSRTLAQVTVGDLDGANKDVNILDDYKYYKDIKELFYNEDVKLDTDKVYRLFILASGTVDSDLNAGNINYLNSNTYMYSDTITILTTDIPTLTNSSLSWDSSTNSMGSKLKIYGPLNMVDDVLKEDEDNREAWKTADYTKMELAKLRYLDGDEDAFTTILGIENEQEIADLKAEAERNKLELVKRITVLEFSEATIGKASQYTLTNNPAFGTGGYAIYKQELGNNKGVLDSPESEAVYTYKLGTTSASRKTQELVNFASGSTITKDVDYWLGSNDTAGMFVWEPVPYANAYKITVKATDVATNGEGSNDNDTIKKDIIVVGQTYYELDNSISDDDRLNEEGYKYSLEIVATVVKNTGTPEQPKYTTADGYFDSNTVATQKENTFVNGDEQASLITGRYFRISAPNNIIVHESGEITWNDNIVHVDIINNFALSYQFSGSDEADATDNNTPSIQILDSVLGTISIKIKAIAKSEVGYLNSSYSNSVSVTKIASPVPRVTDGVFRWGTVGEDYASQTVTATKLTIDNEELSFTDNSVISYQYYTSVTSENLDTYTEDGDLSIYSEGNHDIKIMYKGTVGSSETNQQFYLASEELSYYVTKLEAPKLQNYINTNASSENRIVWEWNSEVKSYKLLFFVNDIQYIFVIIKEGDGTATIKRTRIIDINDLDKAENVVVQGQSWLNNDYFETEGDEIRFKINSIISNLSEEDTNKGLRIFAFAQAIGSLETSRYNGVTGLWETESKEIDGVMTEIGSVETYRAVLSSSFSDKLPISIPSAPVDATYDATTGTLSWSLTNVEDINVGYNIIIDAEYMIESVNDADLANWIKSANAVGQVNEAEANFALAGHNALFNEDYLYYPEIKNRKLVYYRADGTTTYTVFVRDTILVESYRDSNGQSRTPTSYKIKAVAFNYKFELTATAYGSVDVEDGSYKSQTYVYNVNAAFTLFFSGNGSPYIPYTINNEARLTNISKYPNSHYKLVDNIFVQNEWKAINNFGGTLDGNDKMIYNLSVTAYSVTAGLGMSFVYENSGTIKNLSMQVKFSVIGSSEVVQYQVAPVAIINTGIIDNVKITSYKSYNGDGELIETRPSNITVTANTSQGIYVGGIVVHNKNTISNSMVNANITALEKSTKNDARSTYIGGIAYTMTEYDPNETIAPSITNCYIDGEFNSDGDRISGHIHGNYIGGIVETIDTTSELTRCYISENVQFTVTDTSCTTTGQTNTTNGFKGGRLGAIVGCVSDTDTSTRVNIDNCYNLGQVIVNSWSYTNSNDKDNKTISIAGIIAESKVSVANAISISDSYSVVRYAYAENAADNAKNVLAYAIGLKYSSISYTNVYYAYDSILTNDMVNGAGTFVSDVEELNTIMIAFGYEVGDKYPTLA